MIIIDPIIEYIIGAFIDAFIDLIENVTIFGLPIEIIGCLFFLFLIGYFVILQTITPKKMLEKIVNQDNAIYGAFLFSYVESEDGKRYELNIEDIYTKNLPPNFNDFCFTPEILTDENTLNLLNIASDYYRVPQWKYNLFTLFGRIPYFFGKEQKELERFVYQLREELRTLDIQQLTEEKRKEYSFKYAVVTVGLNVLTNVGKDITLLRSDSLWYKKHTPYYTITNPLIDETNDDELMKEKIVQLQKALNTVDVLLARNIILQDYFNSSTMGTIDQSRDFVDVESTVTYIGLPATWNDERRFVLIVLNPAFQRLPQRKTIYNEIKKVMWRYKKGKRLKNFFGKG